MKNANRIELAALTPTPDGYYVHTYNPQSGVAGGIQTTITTKKACGRDAPRTRHLLPALCIPQQVRGDNTMSNTELSATIRELRELRRMADELAAEIETLTDTIKEHMTAAGVDTLAGTDYKVTWRDVSSRRLDLGGTQTRPRGTVQPVQPRNRFEAVYAGVTP